MSKVIGRPAKIDKSILHKLEVAFSNGATDAEACFIANVAPSTLYNYQDQHLDFLERKDWYLERKGRDEFGLKENVSIQHGFSLGTLLEEAARREKELEAQG